LSGISRDARRCALQAIYQFDAVGDADAERIRQTLEGSRTSETAQVEGFKIATGAWEHREALDDLVRPLSPEWPTHRQPMIDRNILRIALYEIRHAGTAGKVAINGAVELAKEFGGEKSFGFVNAVLDRIWKEEASPETSNPDEG
jgi:N utilization substance protein B